MRSGRIAVAVLPVMALVGCSLVASLDDIHVGDGTATTGGDAATPTPPGQSPDGSVNEGGADAPYDAPPDGSEAGATGYANGLVGYWKFESNSDDSSGNNRALVAYRVPAAATTPGYATGKIGQGFVNALGSDFMCAECVGFKRDSDPGLDIHAGNASNEDFTFAIWLYRVANANLDGTWGHYAIADNGQFAIGANNPTGMGAPSPAYPTVTLFNAGSPVGTVNITGFDFRATENLGSWFFLAAYRRGTTLGIRINAIEQTASVNGAVGSPSGTFIVGEDSGGYPWQGSYDEAAFWHRALSAAELDALYNNGAGRSLP